MNLGSSCLQFIGFVATGWHICYICCMNYEPIQIRIDPIRDPILDEINFANAKAQEARDGIRAYMKKNHLNLMQIMEMDEKPEELLEFLEVEFACDRARKRCTKELAALGEGRIGEFRYW